MVLLDKKRSIGVAAKEIGVQEYVIRFWETQFPDFIKPSIGVGGRRYYYDNDINTLLKVKKYLYEDGYTIKGLQNLLKNKKTPEKVQNDILVYNNDVTNKTTENDFNKYRVEQVNNNQNNQLLKSKLLEFKNHLMNFSIKLENV